MMELEMYLDGNLVETTSLCEPLLRQKDYLKTLMVELEKKYAPVLKKFSVKPVYCLCGVQSCINNFVPLPFQISQHTNKSVEPVIQSSNGLEVVSPLAIGELPTRPENTIPSLKVKAA